ncbi:hypothetical protein C8J57DRAFT_1062600 [Mycena rebaudengoi]|nr:hypothetical protein C8J57DRAFT_1062600 [Mycena rebaudengoi]
MKRSFKKRERSRLNIERIKAEIQAAFGRTPTEGRIWRSMKSKDLSRTARYFFWMTTHDAYMVGTNCNRPNASVELQERSECKHCRETETMEHILTHCEVPGRAQIWDLAERLWTKRNEGWPTLGIGNILGCCTAEFKTSDGKIKAGDARLYRIIISESAHLIWKLRCERLIQNEGRYPTDEEIRNRWVHAMNTRLDTDCRMTGKKYGKKALPKDTVLRTWHGTLLNEEYLPDDWTGEDGVLVGIEMQRRLGVRGRRDR